MVKDRITKANKEVIERIINGQPALVGVGKAVNTIPNMTTKTILHAGPPIEWERMSGPLKGAIIGGLIYEGLAVDEKTAIKVATSGDICFEPCHHYNAVGPMAGVVTASMPVWIVENKTY